MGLSLLFLCLSSFWPAWALNLGPAPAGYSWVEFKEVNAAYLKPNGWYQAIRSDEEVATLFISKENMEQLGSYRTGLSVNVIRNVRQRAGVTPSQFAQRTVAKTAASKEVLSQWTTPKSGGTLNVGFRYRDPSPFPALLIHTVLLADDRADLLQILVFGAPESEWEKAWKHGEQMMSDMLIG
ncbi:hypothetical protein YTPLAS18_06560 [Nitrospira sp.]|nr:hypothetical protein YTPLAS18_06560 [Nitrospira sp.]